MFWRKGKWTSFKCVSGLLFVSILIVKTWEKHLIKKTKMTFKLPKVSIKVKVEVCLVPF